MNGIPKETTVAITHDHSMYGLAARRTRGERAVFSSHYAPLFRQGGVDVIDSHRGVRGATDIPRNISDERIIAIANSGGVIGLQFFSVVLSNKAHHRANIDDLIRHIDHIVEIVGVDHVSLGPDFLESNLVNRSADHYAEGIEDITKLPLIPDALVRHGYSEVDIRKILGGNILRVYKRVIG